MASRENFFGVGATIFGHLQFLAAIAGDGLMALSNTSATHADVASAFTFGESRAREADEQRLGAAAPDHPALRALVGALMCAGPGASAAGWREAEGCAQITQRVGLEPVRVRLLAETGTAAWREVCAVS